MQTGAIYRLQSNLIADKLAYVMILSLFQWPVSFYRMWRTAWEANVMDGLLALVGEQR